MPINHLQFKDGDKCTCGHENTHNIILTVPHKNFLTKNYNEDTTVHSHLPPKSVLRGTKECSPTMW